MFLTTYEYWYEHYENRGFHSCDIRSNLFHLISDLEVNARILHSSCEPWFSRIQTTQCPFNLDYSLHSALPLNEPFHTAEAGILAPLVPVQRPAAPHAYATRPSAPFDYTRPERERQYKHRSSPRCDA